MIRESPALNFSPATTWFEAGVWLTDVGIVMTIFIRTVRGNGRADKPTAPAASLSAQGA
ncbi:hypothetical protein [Salinibacterium sp. TMP30]|uniref:hypothetical protein n=1 Tax=Salinibacterium sp. TMP30 TaxID=3138237 RepID=UPI003139C825